MIANFVGVENIFRGVASESHGILEIEVDCLMIVSAMVDLDEDGSEDGRRNRREDFYNQK